MSCWRRTSVSAHIAEDDTRYFEACLPIEEIARRGRDTLRFGPMKPMGLTIRAPAGGRGPWCSCARRTARADSFNLVGFQNHMKFGEQARVLRLIPGLRERRVPALRPDPPQHVHQRARAADAYAATALAPGGLFRRADLGSGGLRGVDRDRADGGDACRGVGARRTAVRPLPRATALGSLCHYISSAEPKNYQPANITFDLLPQLDEATRQRLRKRQEGAPRARSAGGRWRPSTEYLDADAPCLSLTHPDRALRGRNWRARQAVPRRPHALGHSSIHTREATCGSF